jgi:hypothetical protein
VRPGFERACRLHYYTSKGRKEENTTYVTYRKYRKCRNNICI